MPDRLILIRHGLTYWNHEYRYQGHTDIKLHPEGIIQAYALQERFKNEKLQAIYSSDLIRARETAEIIAEPHGLSVNVKSELREINFGVWEGLTYSDLQKHYPELLKLWLESPHKLAVPEGETFEMVRDRSLQAVAEIINTHPSGSVAIITHGGTMAATICGLLDQPLDQMWSYKHKNTAITVLANYQDVWSIEILNDVSHLTD